MASVHERKGLYLRISDDVEKLLDAESGRQVRSPTAIATEVLEAAVRDRSVTGAYDELAPISAAETRAFRAEVLRHLQFISAAISLANPGARPALDKLRLSIFEASADTSGGAS